MLMKIAKAILRLVNLCNVLDFLFKYMWSDTFKEKIYETEFSQYLKCIFLENCLFEKLKCKIHKSELKSRPGPTLYKAYELLCL